MHSGRVAVVDAPHPGEEALTRALFAAGVARDSLAGRLAELVAREAYEGFFQMKRNELVVRIDGSESGLRYALLKLVSAGVLRLVKAGRGLLGLELTLGARLHVASEQAVQRELPFAEEERRAGGEEERSGMAAEEAGGGRMDGKTAVAAPVAAGEEEAAKAQRECAALSRRVAEKRRERAAQAASEKTKEVCALAGKTFSEADLRGLFPTLMADDEEETARDVPFPIPHSPIPLSKRDYPDIPSADVPGGNVEIKARGGNGSRPASSLPRGGQIAALVRKIKAQVPGIYDGTAHSVALLAIEGPLSEHIIAECVAGSGGNGGKFINAVKSHLAGVADAILARHTLRRADGTPQLHRFAYLRPRLAEHGIQLPDAATGLVRTKTRRRA